MQNQPASMFRKGDLIFLKEKYPCKIVAMNTTKFSDIKEKIFFIGTNTLNGKRHTQLCTSNQIMTKPISDQTS